jgi:hypothetical protein
VQYVRAGSSFSGAPEARRARPRSSNLRVPGLGNPSGTAGDRRGQLADASARRYSQMPLGRPSTATEATSPASKAVCNGSSRRSLCSSSGLSTAGWAMRPAVVRRDKTFPPNGRLWWGRTKSSTTLGQRPSRWIVPTSSHHGAARMMVSSQTWRRSTRLRPTPEEFQCRRC